MIEVKGIGKHFGKRKVLDSLDMSVANGEIVSLIGPNGAGKTTLLRIMSTLMRPSYGDIHIDGTSIFEEPSDARKNIGMVGHSTYTYDDLTTLENMKFYMAMNAISRSDFDRLAKPLLKRIGLFHRVNDRAAVLSRGMRQRLAIGRAIIHSPRVLLLDEPFSSLDQKGVDILMGILREEREKQRSILLVSHDIPLAASISDRVDILLGGKISDSIPSKNRSGDEIASIYASALEGGIS